MSIGLGLGLAPLGLGIGLAKNQGLGLGIGLAYFARLRPRTIVCITNIFTFTKYIQHTN